MQVMLGLVLLLGMSVDSSGQMERQQDSMHMIMQIQNRKISGLMNSAAVLLSPATRLQRLPPLMFAAVSQRVLSRHSQVPRPMPQRLLISQAQETSSRRQ